jgi:hypothetical protein
MRSSYPIVLFLSLVVAGTYWYQSTAYICPAPLEYRLGDLNEQFGISSSTAIGYITEAENYWEEATGRDLFIYNEEADFTVDFVFDERQEDANEQEVSRAELDAKWTESEEVRGTIEKLQSSYDGLAESHADDIDAYEARLTSYNQRVNKYNDQGGAPPDIFAELEEERESVNKISRKLNETANDLSKLATEINSLGERGSELVDKYNNEVQSYNYRFGHAGEFTQGDYQGDNINIYKFSNDNEVITVLAHEFGHALGLDHVDDETALMYYLLEDPNSSPELSTADLELFYEVCGQEDTLAHEVRRTIRNLLSIF